MSRAPRIRTSEHLYHVTARGVARRAVFRSDADRRVFLATLGDVVADRAWRCHAYCLMDTHFHLLMQTPRADLPEGMQTLNGTYATRFNTANNTGGHVFQGRYGARVVRSHPHALEVARYIPLNPVRAGLCRDPGDWGWSSYRATAGLAPAPAFLSISMTREWFGGPASYRRFVAAGRGIEDPEDAALATILDGRTLADISMAHNELGYPLRSIARHVGVHHTTLARRLGKSAPKGV